MRNSSIVLLSGGLDSLASFYWALKETDIIMAITFDYGQKALDAEINHSKKICSQFDIKHKVIQCPWFKEMKGSSLTNRKTSIPQVLEKDIDDQKITKQTAKLVWVPNRNGVFVNIAASIAEDMLAGKLIVGFNQEEAETFLDNSSHYLAFTNEALKYSTKDQVVIEAPMIDKTKTEIVKWLLKEKVDLRLIWSCYHDGSKMCGQCESCSRLKRALRENNQESALESFLQTKYINENIVYDGSQLKSHWILNQTHLFGDAIVSFSGVCDVKLHQMVDLEDVINQQPIYSTNMLHFLIEHFDDNLKSAIFRQRLLISIIKDLLVLKTNQCGFIRKGDDIYCGEDKLTVSIATKSLVSTLIHTGINISSKNTPVPTKGLEDFQISAKEFALIVMNQYQQEILSTNQALVKVRAVS